MSDSHLFEKASPDSADRPRAISVIEKFSQRIDLRTGCKYVGNNGACNWGIVNYRCDPAKVTALRQQQALQTQEVTNRVRFLYRTLKAAVENGGSPAAVNDALARYLASVRELLGSPDISTQLLGFENTGALYLLLTANPRLMDQLTRENLDQLSKFSEEMSSLEDRMPKNVSDFPRGALPR